jgi:hydroxymethylglutaryl-CoA lyase
MTNQDGAVKIIECPRDAWQSLTRTIPTQVKVAYLRKLIESGFRHLDAVSFVSPKHVPQMADSEAVMQELTAFIQSGAQMLESLAYGVPRANSGLRLPSPEIIGIVVNERGLQRALSAMGVTTIGYPHSLSPTFLRQNANTTVAESEAFVRRLQEQTSRAGKQLVVYLSMAFGNPYGDPWSPAQASECVGWLQAAGVGTVSLADTVGKAGPREVGEVFRTVQRAAGGVELGVHLHSRPEGAAEKVLAAYEAGCRRFDSALTGLGGCPFAGDELVGNIPTEIVVSSLAARGVSTGIEPWALLAALEATREIRRQYAA